MLLSEKLFFVHIIVLRRSWNMQIHPHIPKANIKQTHKQSISIIIMFLSRTDVD